MLEKYTADIQAYAAQKSVETDTYICVNIYAY